MTELVEVAFVWDSTGSMASCWNLVKKNVEAAITPLLKEMPNLRISLGAHGDYCDRGSSYVTKWQDFSTDLYKLTQFVRNTGSTGGGDSDECYELVLHEAQNLSWSVNSRKILVMIGDANPHSVNYPQNTLKLDWKHEAETLAGMGVNIYAVQALARSSSNKFWRSIAEISNGYHLALGQFTDIIDLITAIVYKQESPERLIEWENEIAAKGRMNRSLDKSLNALGKLPTYDASDDTTDDDYYAPRRSSYVSKRFAAMPEGFVPVPDGRFQMLPVEETSAIKSFVEDNELEFTIGRGFYEFTKTEEIQENKEVIVRDKISGDFFTGKDARKIVGIPFGERGKIKPDKNSKYQIFIQSTSVNRKLVADSFFLYEVAKDR